MEGRAIHRLAVCFIATRAKLSCLAAASATNLTDACRRPALRPAVTDLPRKAI